MRRIKRMFGDGQIVQVKPPSGVDPGMIISFKYELFKKLLSANTELLSLLSDMDQTLKGGRDFGVIYVANQAHKAMKLAFQMVISINMLSGGIYKELYESLDAITSKIKSALNETPPDGNPCYVMDYRNLSRLDVDRVGGKNANLGEMKNRLNLPVPNGFAVTAHAFSTFLDKNSLRQEINTRRNQIFVEDIRLLSCLSREAMDLIESQPLPRVIRENIFGAYDRLWGKDSNVRVAMRSSAVGEDGRDSFAGQYLTMLNVTRDRICEAYISIAASLYSARAVSYRSRKGIVDQNLDMAVACVEMVDAVASGVMYTRHPYDLTDDHILVHAVWGLGTFAVEGMVVPDRYTVTRDEQPRVIHVSVSSKTIQQVCLQDGGVGEKRVELEKQTQPCLSEEQVCLLARYGRIIEDHYREAQDVEWALDKKGKIVILQSRPLSICGELACRHIRTKPVPGYELPVEQAEVACPGLGKGPAVHAAAEEDLSQFPEGGILIADHSSPEYVTIMDKCQGIVVESGSATGHMATLAREFDIPTLIGGARIRNLIPAGADVTVDAYNGRVYLGQVPELAKSEKQPEPKMKGTPAYELLKNVTELITPLHLTSPKFSDFTPSGCRTIHDIIRFCHEKSYEEMVKIGWGVSSSGSRSLKLETELPMDLHLIDVGGGISAQDNGTSGRIAMDSIISAPFRPLLSGVLSVVDTMKPVSLSGNGGSGGRGYAIIADNYMNFSSKAGHHYSVVDAYCDHMPSNNYVTFSLKGGSADKSGRIRRSKAIALILTREGFLVDLSEDMVQARIQKYPSTVIENCLDLLGRLLMFIRRMDTQMTSNRSVEWVVNHFFAGNYSLN